MYHIPDYPEGGVCVSTVNIVCGVAEMGSIGHGWNNTVVEVALGQRH